MASPAPQLVRLIWAFRARAKLNRLSEV